MVTFEDSVTFQREKWQKISVILVQTKFNPIKSQIPAYLKTNFHLDCLQICLTFDFCRVYAEHLDKSEYADRIKVLLLKYLMYNLFEMVGMYSQYSVRC